ncbi:ABC transporter permease [Pseudodesulfovibrio cashew]|uniref:ABC transporter permease n=1 Tax=Pseudodesulfovibrio cashew TaxID=2678688 RepID=UPI001F551E12|nr:ABC transporter permease [Pseudodesulfovibrio cashew]
MLASLPGLVFQGWMTASAALVLIFIGLPLAFTITGPKWDVFVETLADPEVLKSVWLSMSTSAMAAGIAFAFGTPLAYFLARHEFPGKKIVESLVDLPIMIPHPVVGIALLSLTSPNTVFGAFLQSLGVEIMGTTTGIVAVLVFVGMPFYVNTAKSGIEATPRRLENVSRSLGAGPAATFFRVTLPLCWRYMLVGMIMCMARAISEFGAIIIVAYHPMVAPVLMYERFTAYGLKYSQPVAVILIVVSMLFFLLLRTLSTPGAKER